MNYVKTLALAVVAAAALAALVGVGTASATVLCKTEPTGGGTGTKGTTCPEGWAYTAGTEIHGVLDPGTKSVTTTLYLNIECEESTFAGATTNEGSETETVQINVTTWTFGKCNCEVKILSTGSLEIHWVADSFNGTVTSTGLEETVTCGTVFGSIHCIYRTSNTDLGTMTAGTPATIDIANAELLRTATNELCDTDHWDAKYEITSPKPFYVAAGT